MIPGVKIIGEIGVLAIFWWEFWWIMVDSNEVLVTGDSYRQ